MPSSNVCWGIEVGAGSITAIKLEAAGDTLNVLDFAVIPHKKVLSTPDTDPNDVLRVTLGAFVSQYEIGNATVVVSVPGHSAFARFAKLPPVEPKKVPDIVKFEAVQQIPFPIDEVEWDYQTFQAPDSPDIEVGIFAITRERILERLAMLEDVGIVPDAVTLSPVAAYNTLAYDLSFTEQTPGTVILDIGTTSTDLIVAEAGRVWIRTFPIGGHHFTEALVNAFKLPYSKVEKLKKEAESSKHARHIFQAMRPVFADLAQDVNRSLGYYQSLHRDAKLTRLIGLGSTFRLPGLRKYLKQQIQLDVYRLEQFKRINVEGPRAAEFQNAALNLGTAYGLAIQGLGMATLDANLMPAAVIRQAMWKRKVKWFGIAAGVAVAAAGAMAIRPFLDSNAIASAPPSPVIASTIAQARSLKSDAADVTGQGTPNEAAAASLALLQSRDIYAHIADDLGQLLASAQQKAASPAAGAAASPAYIVQDFKTTYLGLASGSEPTGAESYEDTGMPQDVPPRIRVDLTVATTQPDARKFALTTLDGWLRENAQRTGVPYKLEPRGQAKLESEQTLGAASPGAGTSSAPSAETTSPRGRGRGSAFGITRDREDPRGMVSGEATVTGGAGDVSGGSQAGPQPGSEEISKLAPLGEPPAFDAGSKVSTFKVSWDVVIVPPAKATDGGDQ